VPAIQGVGTPSASAFSGFTITASSIQSQKAGVLAYGLNGQVALPFQGGTLCVAPPRRRTPMVNSGGSLSGADCTGQFSLDFNAFAAGALGGSPHPALQIAGTAVDAQWWGRDPGWPAPNNTTLSDGLSFVICP
jgi:hypothetical protein